MAHVNLEYLLLMDKNKTVKGLDIQGGNTDKQFCEGCTLGKQSRHSFKSLNRERKTAPGKLIHCDLCGPIHVTSAGGMRYFMLLKDDYSDYRTVYFLKEKSAEEVTERIQDFINQVKYDLPEGLDSFHCLKTDQGLEFMNDKLETLLRKKGIKHITSTPYTPEQNGVIERDNRTVMEAARSMIFTSKMDKKYWCEAINTAVYLLNRTTNKRLKSTTPYELWTGQKPNLSHIRIFGTEAWKKTEHFQRKKLDEKSKKRILVGYEPNKSYRLLDPETGKIELSCSVIFNEKEIISKDYIFWEDHLEETRKQENDPQDTNSGIQETHEEPEEGEVTEIEENGEGETPSTQKRKPYRPRGERWKELPPPLTTRRRETSQANLISSCLLLTGEPATPEEALSGKESTEWKKAMDEEMKSLHENNTWTLVPKPTDRKLVDCRWIYKRKEKSDGTLDRYKARLVARGFKQVYGIDYEETYSPVVKFPSIRLLLSLAASEDMEILQFDIKTAFLYGELEEEIFMTQPEGYEEGRGLVCHLQKSLYGLKQSPRQWNKKFHNFLTQNGFKGNQIGSMCISVKSI
jgi:transposase InsO family protein